MYQLALSTPSPAFTLGSQPELTSSKIISWFFFLGGNLSQLREWLFSWIKKKKDRGNITTKPDFDSSPARQMTCLQKVLCAIRSRKLLARSWAMPSLIRGVIDLVICVQKVVGKSRDVSGGQKTGMKSWSRTVNAAHRASYQSRNQPGKQVQGLAPEGECMTLPPQGPGRGHWSLQLAGYMMPHFPCLHQGPPASSAVPLTIP